MDKPTSEEIETRLAQVQSGDTLYRHWMKGICYTEGVRFAAELCGAYWLIDAIASHQFGKVKAEPFQVWTLHVASKDAPKQKNSVAAILICTDGDKGDGAVELARQNIEYTDFPIDKITIWVEDGVMLLPAEH